MASSRKHRGIDSILYNFTKGTLQTVGLLIPDTWYKIKARATTASNLPGLTVGSLFRTPKFSTEAITLAAGDEVYPMTQESICKIDISLSGTMGVIDVTDSCDYPYTASMPDGFTALSGSINRMLRYDEETDEIVQSSTDWLNKFFDVVDDDGEGVYSLTEKDDSDLYIGILLNKDALNTFGKIENWWLIPIILNSVNGNIPLKDAHKLEFNWTKGEGPAMLYKRATPADT